MIPMSEFEVKLTALKQLLAEAYEHYFEHSDGYCKSSEGAISIHAASPFYWRDEHQAPASVEIYSYVFGGGRHHHFKDIDEALDAVREWHREELATDWAEVEEWA